MKENGGVNKKLFKKKKISQEFIYASCEASLISPCYLSSFKNNLLSRQRTISVLGRDADKTFNPLTALLSASRLNKVVD